MMYDVALSFAGEDREYVDKIANGLKQAGVKVFYDRFKTAELWGKDLYQYLNSIYKNEANYCIIFISEYYKKKAWTKHELESAQSRAFLEDKEYILPIYIDDVEIPGINITRGHLKAKEFSIEEIIGFTIEKLGLSEGDTIKTIDEDLLSCTNLRDLLDCMIKKVYSISKVDFNQIALSTVSQQHSTNLYVVAGIMSRKKYQYDIITMWGVIGQAFRTGEMIYIKDVLDCEFYVNAVKQTKAEFVIPIKIDGNVVGVINIESEKKDFLDNQQINLLQKITHDFGIMLKEIGYEIQFIEDLPTVYYNV